MAEGYRGAGRGGALPFSGYWLLDGRELVLCSGIHPDFVRTEVYTTWYTLSLRKENNKNKIRWRALEGSSWLSGKPIYFFFFHFPALSLRMYVSMGPLDAS